MNTGKSAPGKNESQSQAPANAKANKPGAPANKTVATKSAGAPQSAGAKSAQSQRAKVVPQKTGPKFGPMDIALLVIGLVVVGAIIWGGTNLGKSNEPASNTGVSGTPGTTTAPPAGERSITPLPLNIPAPGFTLTGVDGNTYSLEQFKGKVVLIEFFAPWCPHCQDDAPMMNRLYDAYQGKNVQILAVSAHPYGLKFQQGSEDPVTMNDLIWFRDNFGVKFPILFDEPFLKANGKDLDVKVSGDYHIGYFPTLYVVGPDGMIASQIQSEKGNPITYERIAGEVDKALGE